MLKKQWLTVFMILVVTLLMVSIPVNAQSGGSVSDDDVNKIAGQIYCPVCENITLDVCPTQACSQWRNLIREKLTAGWSARQIEDYFVEQYGDRVLAVPPRTGLNWLIYVFPFLIILGIALVGFSIFYASKQIHVSKINESKINEDILKKIHNDLIEKE